jgi:hypothetical protein
MSSVSSAYLPQGGQAVFGRAWWITITSQVYEEGTNKIVSGNDISFGQKTWEPEGLHITFNTEQRIGSNVDYWTAIIVIYNMNDPTLQEIIKYGYKVRLDAGYQNQELFSTIFEGIIIQPMWEQENGVDWKLTLNCIVGVLEFANNFVSYTSPGAIQQRELLAQMLSNSRYPLATDAPSLPNDKITRATTFFGQPDELLGALAETNNQLMWASDRMAHFRDFTKADILPTWTYKAGSGLVGTPQQTQDGITLTVLLDPRLQLGGLVELDKGLIIAMNQYTIGNIPNILSASGKYYIFGLRYYGDSRGNDWYTEITGVYNYGLQNLFGLLWG